MNPIVTRGHLIVLILAASGLGLCLNHIVNHYTDKISVFTAIAILLGTAISGFIVLILSIQWIASFFWRYGDRISSWMGRSVWPSKE